MTKLQEIISSIDPKINHEQNWLHLDNFTLDDLEKCMIDYARYCCDLQKTICSENAETKDESGPLTYGMAYYTIDHSTILNAPYPEELQ